MSTFNRQVLQIIGNSLGRAWEALTKPLGNLDRNPGTLLWVEAAMCRLRGSTLFHDEDYSEYVVPNDGNPYIAFWPRFGGSDSVGLGIQGAVVSNPSNTLAQAFPAFSTGNWYPIYDGPPSLEGWGAYKYQSWNGYSTSAIVSGGNSETSLEYAQRATYNSPVRWTGSTHAYVPFFERARYISILATGSPSYVKLRLTQAELEGLKIIDHLTDTPKDIQFYYYPTFVQTRTTGSWGTITLPPSFSTQFTALNYSVTRVSAGVWDFTIDVPSLTPSWTNGTWWHIALYWGSTDNNAVTHSESTVGMNIPFSPADDHLMFWDIKNFFRNRITDDVVLEHQAINDGVAHLVSRNKTNFRFYDGQYSNPTAPSKYTLNDQWPASEAGVLGSLAGYVDDIAPGCAVGVILTTMNQGDAYDFPTAVPYVFVGPLITPEFFSSDWEDSPYFPPTPQDHNLIVKLVLVRAPREIYGIVEAGGGTGGAFDYNVPGEGTTHAPNILERFSIAWMKQMVPSHALPPMGDPLLASYFLTPLETVLTRYRTFYGLNPITTLAFNQIVPGVRTPTSLVTSIGAVRNPAGTASKIFRSFLKNPLDPILLTRASNEPVAIQFNDNAESLVADLAGLPASVELMRLDADNLYLTGRRVDTATEFEIYMEPTNQCATVDPNSAGIKLGQDYTLRLELEDADENILVKDWYINSSLYFLTNNQYQTRINNGQTVIGYYMLGTPAQQASAAAGTLQSIPEFRLQGYAGVVPNLVMGGSQTLFTREVSPVDNTQLTEDEYIKQLQNQGYTQDQINDMVAEYIDAHGPFYVIDTHQYPNLFVAVRSAGVCVSQYTYNVPYWVVDLNVHQFFNPDGPGGTDPSTARADSFTIAPTSAQPQDVEAFGSQASNSDPDLNQLTGGVDKPFLYSTMAFSLTTTTAVHITDFVIKMKLTLLSGVSAINNPSGQIKCSIYADTTDSNGNHIPGNLVMAGGAITYGSLGSSMAEAVFPIAYTFQASTPYWIVLDKVVEPQGGVVCIDSTDNATGSTLQLGPDSTWRTDGAPVWIKISDASSNVQNQNTGLGNDIPILFGSSAIKFTTSSSPYTLGGVELQLKAIFDSTATKFLNLPKDGIQVLLYSDSAGSPNTKLATGSVIAYESITDTMAHFSANISYALSGSTTYWIVLNETATPMGGRIVMNGLGNPVVNIAEEINGSFVLDYGLPVVKFHNQPTTIVGAFNRNTSNINGFLPPPNTTRSNGELYQTDGYWSYTSKPLDQTTSLSIFPRAINVSGTWQYVRCNSDIHIVVGRMIGGQLEYTFHTFLASNVSPTPIVIGDTDAIAYLAVAKVADDLDTYSHGAPRGDHLIIRSS